MLKKYMPINREPFGEIGDVYIDHLEIDSKVPFIF
ncbi:hypothetical protein METH109765_09205 [Mesobacillus thioparans]